MLAHTTLTAHPPPVEPKGSPSQIAEGDSEAVSEEFEAANPVPVLSSGMHVNFRAA